MIVNVRGKEATVDNLKKIDAIQKRMHESTDYHVTSSLGYPAGSIFLGVGVNNGTINVYNGIDPDAGRKTDEELTTLLMEVSPDVIARMKFSPDAKSSNCNGIYYCDPKSHVWTQESNAFHEQVLLSCFRPVLGRMSPADRRHVQSKRGRGDILYAVASRQLHRRFDELLDSNLDMFVLDNGLFDMSSSSSTNVVPHFRPLEQNDYVSMTAGWSYDASAANDTRHALDAFLRQVFPVDIERRVILTYIAHLLSGRRTIKKFLVLTDRRAGNNGKSTFAKLLQSFFGSLCKSSTKFVCKGSFDQDRNSHDGGLQNFKGKRLIIAEELKHTMTLDDAMLKSYSGGEGTLVEGRKMGSADEFRFVWQGGFILIFNQGDCPKFDAADQAFMDRIIVAPMRSKFVRLMGEDDGDYTYEMDVDIVARLPTWRSALADVLLEHLDTNVLITLPPSMSEWRQGIVEGANPLSDWIEELIEVTGVQTDYIIMGELKSTFSASGSHVVARSEFPGLARAYLLGQPGVTYKEVEKVAGDPKRGVMRGVRQRLQETQRGVS
ncbi:putative helicase [Tetrabaena socialis]|uniref:Putative helicase n=1 Tax=Tetrabaena socialis TaxID=47790 RepID=A0A2J7ZUB0_9CHLO|nr:putative helicase [Tetrabaena socialis]|eukprot:PNH03854.1 putative helicase [Tetrabaena socialis]